MSLKWDTGDSIFSVFLAVRQGLRFVPPDGRLRLRRSSRGLPGGSQSRWRPLIPSSFCPTTSGHTRNPVGEGLLSLASLLQTQVRHRNGPCRAPARHRHGASAPGSGQSIRRSQLRLAQRPVLSPICLFCDSLVLIHRSCPWADRLCGLAAPSGALPAPAWPACSDGGPQPADALRLSLSSPPVRPAMSLIGFAVDQSASSACLAAGPAGRRQRGQPGRSRALFPAATISQMGLNTGLGESLR